MRRMALRGLTIRAALLVGFTLTVGLWVFTGYDFARRMAVVEDESAIITARYMQAQEQLAAVRAQVLLASVYVRDALLDPSADVIPLQAKQLDDTYARIDRALQQYQPILGTAEEQQHVERLRRELGDFRRTTLNVLTAKRRDPTADARVLLNREVVPRRESAVRVSEEVQALNRTAFVQHQTDISRLHRVAERQTWQRLGLALLASLAIALVAGLYAGRLERRLWKQMDTNEQNTRALQHLSTRVIGAQEEQRRTIARELHDEVGQVLTAMKVEIAVAQRTLQDSGRHAGLLADAQSLADSALCSVRDLSQLLHPALLDDLGLSAAVEWQAANVSKRHGLRVDVAQEGLAMRLPPETELAAYRIVQEALTNVTRHAHATTCRVTLRRDARDLEITVEDDGRGFDPTAVHSGRESGGLGLVSMRERAVQLEGNLAVQSARGGGTRVQVRLPLRDLTLQGTSSPAIGDATVPAEAWRG